MTSIVRVLSLVAAASLQAASPQSRAAAEAGRVQGRVFAAATGLPIPGATVRLNGREVSRATPSDDDGYFEFEEVPPGAYLVTAVMYGYAIGASGRRTPSDVPRSFELRVRETRSDADIELTSLGSISGQIVDEAGRPMAGVGVQAVRRSRGLTDDRPVTFGGGATTDVNGRFSVSRLPAGSYFVIATHRPARAPSSAPELPFIFTLTSTTYYPGTAVPAEAQTVRVDLGSERANVTFTMQPSRLARISGVVVDSRGVPAADTVVTINRASTDVPLGALGTTFSEVGVDGSFSLSNVPPGVYSLDVRSKSVYEAIARTGTSNAQTIRAGPEFATVPVRVAGDDIDSMIVRTDRGFSLSGRLIAEGPTPQGLQSVRISATHVGEASQQVRFALSGEAQPEADGSFEFQKLLGPQMIRVSGLPAGWALKRVRYAALDITDEGIDVAFDVPGVDIVVARQSEIAGVVTERRGLSIPGATVVVFAEDRRRWTLPFTRYVKVALSSSSGTFTISGLPSGRYYAAAVPALIEGKLADPDEDDLEMLIPRAARFSLVEGERRSLDLRLE